MDIQDQQSQPEHGGNVIAVNSTASTTSCGKVGGPPPNGGPRQTSTRWTPTAEQIRILRDLYYNYGVRSPNAEQIQRISARLRQFGKIEGKNVFYWFQNHKARERQKKRLASDSTFHHTNAHGTMLGCGKMASYRYGSVAMEKKFTECSLSASGSGGFAVQRYGSAAVDPPLYASSSYCNVFGNTYHCGSNQPVRIYPQEEGEDEEDGEKEDDGNENNCPEIETLPLFPMRDNEDSGGNFFVISPSPNPVVSSDLGNGQVGHHNNGVGGAWHGEVVLMAQPWSSLELSLSSCTGKYPGSASF